MLDALTLDQARIFLAVAETGSFSAAAKRVQRVQSAVSQSIVSLERTLETQLFDRSGRRPVLTKSAEAILPEARELVRRAEALRAKAKAMAGGVEPELAIAVDPLFPLDILVAALRTVQARFPVTRIALTAEGMGRPERLLRAGKVSMSICAPETTAPKDLESDFLTKVTMMPVIGASHPLIRDGGRPDRAQLVQAVQLILTDDEGPGAWSRGVISASVWRFQDLRTRLEFLRAGFGWCNLPTHVVEPYLRSGELVALQVDDAVGYDLSVFAVHMPAQPYGACANALLEELKSALEGGRDSSGEPIAQVKISALSASPSIPN